MRRALPLVLVLLGWTLLGGTLPSAEAADMGTYRFDPGGEVVDVRVVDMDADGRRDLVLIVREPESGDETLVVARTPATPTSLRR